VTRWIQTPFQAGDPEVSMVKGGHLAQPEALRDGDDGRVGRAEWETA